MVDRNVVVIVAVAVGVVVVGGVAGAMLLGGGDSGDTPTPDGSDGDANGESAPTAAPATTATANGTATNGTGTAEETPFPTLTPTPTATATPTVTPTPTDVPTRTPMLTRRFSEREVELELRRMLNDWREGRGLQPFTNANGSLVGQIDTMATNHSTAIADRSELVHTSNNLSVAQRYRAFDLAERCKFKKEDAQYIVTPAKYQFEVLHRTYAGRNYQDDGETVYHENETQVARDIFQEWTSNPVYRDVLEYPEINRIGVGIAITEDNDVWATGNICGGSKTAD